MKNQIYSFSNREYYPVPIISPSSSISTGINKSLFRGKRLIHPILSFQFISKVLSVSFSGPFQQGFNTISLMVRLHFPQSCHSVLGKSLNMVAWEKIPLLKKVLKCGHFLQGKCHNMVLCISPCWNDLSANKGCSVLIRIHVVLVYGIGAKWLAHGKLIGGLFPEYSQMDSYLAEDSVLSSGKVRLI